MNHPSQVAVLAGCECTDCHPSEAAYTAGCKCDPCMRRRMRVRKRHHLRITQGPVMVSDEQLVAKLTTLIGEGYGATMIAHAAGRMSDTVIIGILNGGRTDRARRARLMRVTRDDILTQSPDNAHVPPIGAQRRVQALMRIGWSQVHLADGNGTRLRLLSDIASGKRKYIRAVSHREIADLYTRLCMVPGPSDISRVRAEKRGFAPPLAWDSIDDPAAQPNYGATEDLRMTLWKEGKNDQEIAAEVGINHESVRRWRKRNRLTANYERSPDLGNEGDNRHTLWQQGLTDADIGRTVGKHPDIIRRWRVKHGLASNRRTA